MTRHHAGPPVVLVGARPAEGVRHPDPPGNPLRLDRRPQRAPAAGGRVSSPPTAPPTATTTPPCRRCRCRATTPRPSPASAARYRPPCSPSAEAAVSVPGRGAVHPGRPREGNWPPGSNIRAGRPFGRPRRDRRRAGPLLGPRGRPPLPLGGRRRRRPRRSGPLPCARRRGGTEYARASGDHLPVWQHSHEHPGHVVVGTGTRDEIHVRVMTVEKALSPVLHRTSDPVSVAPPPLPAP